MGASIKNVALLMLFAAAVVGSSAQTTHQVLGSLGWTIPPAGSVAYTAWAANQTFRVGDTLVFTYTTGQHDVAEVTKQAFGNCNATSPISLQTTGPTSIPLTSAGEHYYICTFGSHCSLGQKLAVNVSAASGAAPAPAPGTPAAPTPVPAPAPAATPTPPPAAAPTPGTPTAPSPSPTPGASPPSPPGGAPSPSTGAPSPLPSGPTPTPSPPTPTPAPPTTTPTPTGSTTPPPLPPGSSATSLKATGLFATVLSVALALLY